MTKRQEKALQGYIDELRPMLGLTEWQVNVRGDLPQRDTSVADCRTIPATRCANIRVCADFFDHESAYQRETVVHELLHCVFAASQDQVRSILPDYLPGKAGSIFRDCWFQAHEYSVDQLAVALSPLFPLPEFP